MSSVSLDITHMRMNNVNVLCDLVVIGFSISCFHFVFIHAKLGFAYYWIWLFKYLSDLTSSIVTLLI